MLRDPVSSSSHFAAALLAIVATMFICRLAWHDRHKRYACLLFGFCSVLLYTASGLYHALRLPAEDLRVFQKLDMSAIFTMIAGSVTPLAVILVRGRLRWLMLIGTWGFAVVGIATLWSFTYPQIDVMVGAYVAMSGAALFGVRHYWRAFGWSGMKWVVASFSVYFCGAVIEFTQWPNLWPKVVGAHELMHFCDIGGTFFYLALLIRYVIHHRHSTDDGPNQPDQQHVGHQDQQAS